MQRRELMQISTQTAKKRQKGRKFPILPQIIHTPHRAPNPHPTPRSGPNSYHPAPGTESPPHSAPGSNPHPTPRSGPRIPAHPAPGPNSHPAPRLESPPHPAPRATCNIVKNPVTSCRTKKFFSVVIST